MAAELEDVVGRLFERLRPELASISRKLFRLEGRIDRGFLTLKDFLQVKHEIALLRIAIEDLPLLASDTTALQGTDTGTHVAS